MALTKECAISCDMFHNSQHKNWRRNGQTQVWKTRPDDYRVPVKFGLYRYDQITPSVADEVHCVEHGCNK